MKGGKAHGENNRFWSLLILLLSVASIRKIFISNRSFRYYNRLFLTHTYKADIS